MRNTKTSPLDSETLSDFTSDSIQEGESVVASVHLPVDPPVNSPVHSRVLSPDNSPIDSAQAEAIRSVVSPLPVKSRRDFLKTAATVTTGLLIGFRVLGPLRRALAEGTPAGAAPKVYPPDAFIHIAPDSQVSIIINKCEMGQGVFTSMSQLIAEELDCDWRKIIPLAAPVDPVYNHTMFGALQITGGSTSLASSYDQYRKIGATARLMMMQVAGKKWGVDPATLETENGFVVNPAKDANPAKLSYGELAAAAQMLPIPEKVALKDPREFKIIGQSIQRLDAHEKSHGTAIFGIDVRIPKMARVMVVRPPVFGATLKSFDDKAARKVSGVIDVVRVENRIAVVAQNSWAARQGRDAIVASWDMHGQDSISHTSLMKDFKKLADTPMFSPQKNPEAVALTGKDKHALAAEYEFPYLSHAQMEPLNCTVNFDGKTAEFWSGFQMPTVDQAYAAQILGIPKEKVKINAVYAGGSFGRRASKSADYVAEAASIAKVLKRPIQILWSREDDMSGGYWRPMAYHRAKISTDKKGQLLAWHHTVVSQSIMAGGAMEAMLGGGADPTVTEGVTSSPYKLPKMQVDLVMPTLPIPTLWFRSVGHTHTAYVMETLIDELAHRAKKSPLEFRQSMLEGKSRQLAVIELLKKQSPIGKPAKKGHAYGVAVHESFNTVVGHVVEASIENGVPKIHHVWSAVHCGKIVNPEGARTQVEGGIIFGLSMALFGEIKIERGEVTTNNFNSYQVVRMNQVPKMEVHFVESEDSPTGLGEPGVPPVAPALANALFQLTKHRIRKLPIDLSQKA